MSQSLQSGYGGVYLKASSLFHSYVHIMIKFKEKALMMEKAGMRWCKKEVSFLFHLACYLEPEGLKQ